MSVARIVLLLSVFAAAHNCKILTIVPGESVVVTCGDWAGGIQSYWVPSKAQWAKVVQLDTTEIADTTHR